MELPGSMRAQSREQAYTACHLGLLKSNAHLRVYLMANTIANTTKCIKNELIKESP
jgi:hypothetical protein